MKNSILIAGIILLAASCSSESDVTVNNPEVSYAPVSVHVSGFTSEQEEFASARGLTRAVKDLATYTDVKAITLAFYSGSTEVFKSTQLRADNTTYTTFGDFSTSLSVGSYTMVVLAYGSESEITLTSPTSAAYTSDKGRETFVYTQSVNVNTTSGLDLSATLTRVVTKLKLKSTDNMPNNIAKVITNISAGGLSFNPTTGFATVNTGLTNEVSPSVGFGEIASFASYFFLATDEQMVNVTITVQDDAENVLFSKVVNNVPMKRNRCTVLTGKLFSTDATSTFSVETTWLDDHNVTF